MPHSEVEPEGVKMVHYHAGGKPGSRPILTGKDAKPTFDKIPMVDMTKMFSSELEDRKSVAAEVGKACREVGFFYAQNHNVPEEVVQATFQAISEFFSQDHETKMESHINNSEHFRGYEPAMETKLDPDSRGDLKESFLMGEDGVDEEQHPPPGSKFPQKNQWPVKNPEFRKAIYTYYGHLLAFSRQLLHIFALALELPEEYFDEMCTFPMTAIRSLHYPPQEVEGGQDVGIGAHTDYCWFTLVCQDDVPALQVLNDNGIWVDALPTPRTFVVNIGDFLMQATSGTFQSTVHRVVNLTGQRRFSMPFFFSPNEDAVIRVLPGYHREGEPEAEGISVGDYFRTRLFHARYKHPASIKYRQQMEAQRNAGVEVK